jgi:hypothetical protein
MSISGTEKNRTTVYDHPSVNSAVALKLPNNFASLSVDSKERTVVRSHVKDFPYDYWTGGEGCCVPERPSDLATQLFQSVESAIRSSGVEVILIQSNLAEDWGGKWP